MVQWKKQGWDYSFENDQNLRDTGREAVVPLGRGGKKGTSERKVKKGLTRPEGSEALGTER